MCPNGAMGSDFSALDAELEALGAGSAVDALSIARSYAGTASVLFDAQVFVQPATGAAPAAALSDIDDALQALDGETSGLHAGRAFQGSSPSSIFPRMGPVSSGERLRPPTSEEIVLPDPMTRDQGDASGELSLDGSSPRSGSFTLDGVGILPGNRDDTIETTEEELLEADVDLLDASATAAPIIGSVPSALFDMSAPANSEAQREADAAFAELFAEATRQSAMPGSNQHDAPASVEDTAIFDSGGIDFVENLDQSAALADSVAAEELDSAEFEIITDNDSDEDAFSVPSSTPPAHASQAPEKRPSFLGRLFGRKEE